MPNFSLYACSTPFTVWAQPCTRSWKKRATTPTHRPISARETAQGWFFTRKRKRQASRQAMPHSAAGTGATGTWNAPKKQPKAPRVPSSSSAP